MVQVIRRAVPVSARPERKAPEAWEVRALRRTLDWTQEEFAKHLGVPRWSVMRWELGRHKMSPLAQRRFDMAMQQVLDLPSYRERLQQAILDERPDSAAA